MTTEIQAGIRQVQNNIRDHIAKYGQSNMAVLGEPSFTYSIGLWEKQRPDILIFRLPPTGEGNAIMNMLGNKAVGAGAPWADEEIVSLGGKHGLKVLHVDREFDEFTFQARNYYGHNHYAVVQLLIPDKDGRFPDQRGCDPKYQVPLLQMKAQARLTGA